MSEIETATWSQRTGGDAFPSSTQCGMTLRDWFAGQCLPTLAADYQSRPEHVVSRAYEIADAMLKAREIKP